MLNKSFNIKIETSKVFASYGKVITSKDGTIGVVGLDRGREIHKKILTAPLSQTHTVTRKAGGSSRGTNICGKKFFPQTTVILDYFSAPRLRNTALLPVTTCSTLISGTRLSVRHMVTSGHSGAPAPRTDYVVSPTDANSITAATTAAAGYYATIGRGRPNSAAIATVFAGAAVVGRVYAHQVTEEATAVNHRPVGTVPAVVEMPVIAPAATPTTPVVGSGAPVPLYGAARPASIFYPGSPAQSMMARRASGPAILPPSPGGLRPGQVYTGPRQPTSALSAPALPGLESKVPGQSKFYSITNASLTSEPNFGAFVNSDVDSLASIAKTMTAVAVAGSFFGDVYLIYIAVFVCIYYLAKRIAKYFN